MNFLKEKDLNVLNYSPQNELSVLCWLCGAVAVGLLNVDFIKEIQLGGYKYLISRFCCLIYWSGKVHQLYWNACPIYSYFISSFKIPEQKALMLFHTIFFSLFSYIVNFKIYIFYPYELNNYAPKVYKSFT